MLDQIDTLRQLFGDDIVVEENRVTVNRDAALASPVLDTLVRSAVFGDPASREFAR